MISFEHGTFSRHYKTQQRVSSSRCHEIFVYPCKIIHNIGILQQTRENFPRNFTYIQSWQARFKQVTSRYLKLIYLAISALILIYYYLSLKLMFVIIHLRP